jgi:uncharacterized membrane protein YhiD involved in acid resistance
MDQFLAQVNAALNVVHKTENTPQLVVGLLSAIVFGYVLKKTYLTYFADNEPQDAGFARSLVAIIPALTVTFMVIQSSLALSLGLLGSLSVVRFRSNLKRADEVSFILVAIAVSIACGVGMPLAAVALTVMMYIYAVTRRLAGRNRKNHQFAVISFSTRKKVDVASLIAQMEQCSLKPQFVSSRAYDGITSFVFNALNTSPNAHAEVSSMLQGIDADSQINIFHPSENIGA